jgi:hypothetical protein
MSCSGDGVATDGRHHGQWRCRAIAALGRYAVAPGTVPVHLVPLAERCCLPCNGHCVQRQVGQQLAQVPHQHIQLALRPEEFKERLTSLCDVQCERPPARLVLSEQVEGQVCLDGAIICGQWHVHVLVACRGSLDDSTRVAVL